jgi:hypothetical protein
MRRLFKVSAAFGAAILMYCVAAVVSPSVASAADNVPCGAPWWHSGHGITVQTCPDWAPNNWIPVYNGTQYGASVVGHIYAPGGDWYVCQLQGATANMSYGGVNYANNWWAQSRADNGQWGWVPEIFFQGGNNYERDAALRLC